MRFVKLTKVACSSLLLLCTQVSAQSSQGFELDSLMSRVSTSYLAYQKPTMADDLNGRTISFDFDVDGELDTLHCARGSGRLIRIISGKSGQLIHSWRIPEIYQSAGYNFKTYVNTCDVVNIYSNRPSVVLSAYAQAIEEGMGKVKQPVEQVVLYNGPSGFNTVKIPDGNSGYYSSDSRDVDCVAAPDTPGALCFYPSYSGATKLFRITSSFNSINAADITAATELPWGVSGGLPTRNICPDSDKNPQHPYTVRDGANMTSGAWLDINSDGLPDLVTVGQHTSFREHVMYRNAHGQIKFNSRDVLQPNEPDSADSLYYTEFLHVRAPQNLGGTLEFPCVFVTGENRDQSQSSESLKWMEECGGMEDHLRCYDVSSNDWVKKDLSSALNDEHTGYNPASFITVGDKKLYISKSDASLSGFTYSTPYYGPVKGFVDLANRQADGAYEIRGWACDVNNVLDPNVIEVWTGNGYASKNITNQVVISRYERELGVDKACLTVATETKARHGYKIQIAPDVVADNAYEKIFVKAKNPNRNVIKQLTKSGQFSIKPLMSTILDNMALLAYAVQSQPDSQNRRTVVIHNKALGLVSGFQVQGDNIFNNATLKLDQALIHNVSQQWTIVAVADLNGDGQHDLLWRNMKTGETYRYLLNGLHITNMATIHNAVGWDIIATGDFNGDGTTDLLYQNPVDNQFESTNGFVWVHLLNNNGKIYDGGKIAEIEDNNWRIKDVYRINGDSTDDILWQYGYPANENYQEYEYLMYGKHVVMQPR